MSEEEFSFFMFFTGLILGVCFTAGYLMMAPI